MKITTFYLKLNEHYPELRKTVHSVEHPLNESNFQLEMSLRDVQIFFEVEGIVKTTKDMNTYLDLLYDYLVDNIPREIIQFKLL